MFNVVLWWRSLTVMFMFVHCNDYFLAGKSSHSLNWNCQDLFIFACRILRIPWFRLIASYHISLHYTTIQFIAAYYVTVHHVSLHSSLQPIAPVPSKRFTSVPTHLHIHLLPHAQTMDSRTAIQQALMLLVRRQQARTQTDGSSSSIGNGIFRRSDGNNYGMGLTRMQATIAICVLAAFVTLILGYYLYKCCTKRKQGIKDEETGASLWA